MSARSIMNGSGEEVAVKRCQPTAMGLPQGEQIIIDSLHGAG